MPTAFDAREREDISRRLLEAALEALRGEKEPVEELGVVSGIERLESRWQIEDNVRQQAEAECGSAPPPCVHPRRVARRPRRGRSR